MHRILVSQIFTNRPCLSDEGISDAMLSCGLHRCPSKCHQIADHSRMACHTIVRSMCPAGHPCQRECKDPVKPCSTCEREKRETEQREREEFDHAVQMADLEQRIAKERQNIRQRHESDERAQALKQKEADLRLVRSAATTLEARTPEFSSRQVDDQINPSDLDVGSEVPPIQPEVNSDEDTTGAFTEFPRITSSALARWEQQKMMNNERNEALDEIMAMKGLEKVKDQILAIKDKKDIAVLQGSDLKKERFNVAMLGNPGTG